VAGHRGRRHPLGYHEVMHPLIEQSRVGINQLCQQFAVQRLELFGSATETNGEVGDFDFIVQMAAHETSQARRVIALADRLEALLGKPVDILSSRAIRNPYFAQAVQRQRVALYDRA
jgi:uncharacterized protein